MYNVSNISRILSNTSPIYTTFFCIQYIHHVLSLDHITCGQTWVSFLESESEAGAGPALPSRIPKIQKMLIKLVEYNQSIQQLICVIKRNCNRFKEINLDEM